METTVCVYGHDRKAALLQRRMEGVREVRPESEYMAMR